MIYDRMVLGRKAKELGFNRDVYEKVCRLVDILRFFENDSLLSHILALKGGTALNLTIFDVPRLSVDIDLDYSEGVSKEEMIRSRSLITERISKYMDANGYVISRKSKTHYALDSFVYEYVNAGGMKDNIKIEINYMNRCHIFPCERRAVADGFSDTPVTVLCVHPIELYGSKIVALLNRSTPRDLFDVFNLSSFIKLNAEERDLLRKCVAFYLAVASDEIREKIDFGGIQSITQQSIKRELLPVLKEKYFDAENAKKTCIAFLNDLLSFTEKEQAFLRAFADRKYQPELLFEKTEEAARIQNHPMAIHKCTKPEKESVIDKLNAAKRDVSAKAKDAKHKTQKPEID